MTDSFPEGAKRRGRTTGVQEPIPPPVPVAVARPRAVRTTATRAAKTPSSVDDDAGDVGFERISSDKSYRTYLIIGDDSTDHSRRSIKREGSLGRRRARADLSATDRSTLLNYMDASEAGGETIWACRRCHKTTLELKNDGSVNTTRMQVHVRRCYGVRIFEERSAESENTVDTGTEPKAAACRSFRVVCEELPDFPLQLPTASGDDEDCSELCRTHTTTREEQGRRSERADLSPKERSVLSNYLCASGTGQAALWTCKKCDRALNDRKSNGCVNTANILFHVRQCYDLDAASFEDLCARVPTVRGCRSLTGSAVADVSPRERFVLSNYLHASGTGQAARWTCKKCDRAMNERKIHGTPNITNIFFHVRHCYGLDASSFEDLGAEVSTRSNRGDMATYSAAASSSETPSSSRPSSPKLQQEIRIVRQFMEPVEGTSSTWRCQKCGDSMRHGMRNEGGKEFTATGYSNLVRHLRGCVGGSVIRGFLAAETDGASDRSRKESFASVSSLTESELDETAEVRDGSVPYWNMDVVLNVPETPHDGYTTLVKAVSSAKVPRGQLRWEYLVIDQVSKIMNAALPKRARYLVQEADGAFRLASPFELRGKILEIFSQRNQNDNASEGDPEISSVPLEIVGEDIEEGAVPREVSVSSALWVGQRSARSLNRKRDRPHQPVDRRPLGEVESERRVGNLKADDGAVRPTSPPDAISESSEKRDFVAVDAEPMNWDGSSFRSYV
jgi:ribosomal protein L37AE/L43A